jgi:hypothetical protein
MVSDRPTPEAFAAGDTWPDRSISPYLRVRDEFIFEPRPASTGMGVRELAVRGTSIEVDLICIADGGTSVGSAAPVGVPMLLAGYSPALRRGDWIFLAGELPTDWVGDISTPFTRATRARLPGRQGSTRISGTVRPSRLRPSMCCRNSPRSQKQPRPRSIAPLTAR